MCKIVINDIQKSFKKKSVLKNITFTINKGDLIYIKGKNGCGKSTLLKIIAGLLVPDVGVIKGLESFEIGGVIENPVFLENESAYTNLRYLYNLKNKFNEKEVKRLMDMFDLDLYSKMHIKNYSLGMKQKLGIIQAIMEEQNLILLDEPIRGLDEDSINIFISLIEKLHKENKTIIICAHDGVNKLEYDYIYEIKNGICELCK